MAHKHKLVLWLNGVLVLIEQLDGKTHVLIQLLITHTPIKSWITQSLRSGIHFSAGE